ncbi:helix-turn-helix domain-containing protein [Paenibacillus sp.]|jgi:transcriptional regulator with XRE-family HTH domain|uniref:helix-turn-helix domain-containing protein n=1 Tax=Paenibacillus sp. TaxID=58172 RepID=UPI002816CDBB|nr:helix-turn-helix domain-containing protein [Paenibacillus sp.]MDR0269854.1 helix-turn-helix domain-containing protein [Paenibacillus sp.]
MKNELDFSQINLRKKYQMLRKLKKIKLKQLSEIIGVTVPMLSMYENEIVNLDKDKEKIYRESIISLPDESRNKSLTCKEVYTHE